MTDTQDDDEQTDDTQETTVSPSKRENETNDTLTDLPVRRYLTLGTMGLLVILALVSVHQLYTSVSTTIDIWISEAYAPFFRAAFNLVVLLVALAGLTLLLRRKDDLFSAL